MNLRGKLVCPFFEEHEMGRLRDGDHELRSRPGHGPLSSRAAGAGHTTRNPGPGDLGLSRKLSPAPAGTAVGGQAITARRPS